MLYEIFKFEILYRIKRLDTYIFFLFLFLFSIVGVDFIYSGVDLGPVKRNAPLIIARTMGVIAGISMMVTSLIMGVPILRDFEYQMESLVFVNPIKKRDYLLGRFLGSFVILMLIYTALIWGNAVGELMPWRNPDDLLAFDIMRYVQPYFTIVLPILFFGAALFFVTGALSKKLIVVYTQGLFTFVLFLLTRSIENRFLAAILDPFSLTTLSELTKNWSPIALNSQLMPLSGVLLYSKLFWIGIGLLIVGFGYFRFKFQVVSNGSKKKRKVIAIPTEEVANFNNELPLLSIRSGLKAQCAQLFQHAWFYFISILKEVSFWAIVISAMVIILINSISLGTTFGVDSYPATYFIVEELLEMSVYFFIIVMVFYSGELIWKERGAKLDLIYDALPSNNGINLMGKFIALAYTYMVIMLALILAGIVFQSTHGYYNFELDVYFISFFGDLLPTLLLFTFISFFIHVVVNKKFVGYILVLTFFITSIALSQLGYDHDLYRFGGHNIGTYSQMNGFGHFIASFLWVKAYWFVFCGLLMLVATLFLVRGTETRFRIRLKQAKQRITPSVVKTGLVGLVLFISLGSFIFYNTNVLNKRWSDTEETAFRADYEQTLKQFEQIPQPTLVDVNMEVELYPASRNYTAKGVYTFVNKDSTVIKEIHVQKLIDNQVTLEYLEFDMPTRHNEKYLPYSYYVYSIKDGLQPGDSIQLKFKQVFTTKGFESGATNMQVLNNGTFFNNKDFPTIGYNNKYELRRADDRVAAGLHPRKGMATRDDAFELKNGVNGDDGYTINFEMVIGTAVDQTAIAPGKLVNSWKKENRAYFHYKMDRPMINFYAVVSAKYEIVRDTWIPKPDALGASNPVDLEIYYHKGHDYNLTRMFTAMKKSFDYYSSNFSAYQYSQMRIMEFPRYASFAQSFPNTVPFSESLGFVLDIDDSKDVDMAFYVTAHELAHQWWGLQVVASNVQGRLFILETLSQYAAMMVLKEQYGKEKVLQFVAGQLDRYVKNSNGLDSPESPLALVEKQDYIYYNKGAVNMFILQEKIGEKQVNLALKRFVQDWNAFDPKFNKERYATSADLLEYFDAVTPDSLKTVVYELFETVTSHDAAIKKAAVVTQDDGRYALNLHIQLDKWQNSTTANKAIIPNTTVAVAIYGLDADDKEILLKLHEVQMHTNNKVVSLVFNTNPTKVVLDPNYLFVDTNRENNTKEL